MPARWWNDGDWTIIPTSAIARVASDICCAINERQRPFSPFWRWEPDDAPFAEDLITSGHLFDFTAGQDVIAHEWNTPAGSTVAFPSPLDLQGAAVGDTYWPNFIDDIRLQIEGLLASAHYYQSAFTRWWEDPPGQQIDYQRFQFLLRFGWFYETQAPDFDTSTPGQYAPIETIADLLGVGSYGNSWIPVASILDARIWKQLREAIINAYMGQFPDGKTESFPGVFDFTVNLTTAMDVALSGAAIGDRWSLNGIPFTGSDATSASEGKYVADSGAAAAVTAIAGIINDATYGVAGVTATANGTTLELSSDDPASIYLWPIGLPETMLFTVTAQTLAPVPEAGLKQRHGSVQTDDNSDLPGALNAAYSIAIGAPKTNQTSSLFPDVVELWEQMDNVSPYEQTVTFFDTGVGSMFALGTTPGKLLLARATLEGDYRLQASTSPADEYSVNEAIDVAIDIGTDSIIYTLPTRPDSVIGTPDDPKTNLELSRISHDTLAWLDGPWFERFPVGLWQPPAANPVRFRPLTRLYLNIRAILGVRVRSSFSAGFDFVADFPDYTFRVIEFDDTSGLQWY